MSKKWKNKRQYILHRDGFLCQECRKYGRNVEAKIVHHIVEVDDEPSLKMVNNNLISVCYSCHNRLHPEKGGHRIKR
jgi:5-methylcytosine-specific restriction endonuclease McrA